MMPWKGAAPQFPRITDEDIAKKTLTARGGLRMVPWAASPSHARSMSALCSLACRLLI